jgi:hypothetical protein
MTNFIKNITKLQTNQDGVAAFFVTIMVMIIFGVLILSFSQISNKEGTNAVDRVLSTQALYAAQSGINNTYSIIKGLEDQDKPVPQQNTSCNEPNYSGQTVGDAKYTCILVNTNPSTLTFNCGEGLCPNNSIIAHVESVESETNPLPLNKLDISWKDSIQNPSCPNSNPNFPPAANWGNCPAVLQVNLVPFASGTENLQQLDSSVETFFLYPDITSSNGPVVSSGALDGQIISANCSGTTCTASVTGLTSTEYYVRIQFYYSTPNEVDFTGYDNNTQVAFSYSQIQIDSTGVSQNGTVLKRLSAYINPVTTSSLFPPNYAVQSYDSICKSLVVDNYSNALYEIVPPNSSLDPYTDLGLTVYTGSAIDQNNSDLKLNNPPTDGAFIANAPLGLGIEPTQANTATAAPPIEDNHTEVTTTNPADPCNPI